MHLHRDCCLRLLDITTDIHAFDVHKGPAIRASILTLDGWRAVFHRHIRHIAEGNSLAADGHDRQQRQLFRRVAIILRIAQIHRIPFQSFNGLGDVHATNRRGDHLLYIGNVQTIAGSLLPANVDRDIAPPRHPLGIDRCSPGHLRQHLFKTLADCFYFPQVRARHLDADRRFDACGQHVDAGLDRHHPGVGQAGKPDQCIQFLCQRLGGHSLAPLLPWFELDEGLDHRQRCGVCRGLCPADFTEHGFHFGHGGDQLVGLLQEFPGLTD